MKKYGIVLLVLLVAMSVSCSGGDLSRGKAKSILENYPEAIRTYMNREILIKYDEEGVRKFNSLASKGYGSITQQYRGNNYIADYYWQFHPNPKIVPFVLGGNDYHLELKIGEIRVTEVTGITKAPMDESGRIVEYLVRAVPNELAEIFPSDIKSGEVQKRYAEFKKYDDGWRLLR
jgi:hypothetical protein